MKKDEKYFPARWFFIRSTRNDISSISTAGFKRKSLKRVKSRISVRRHCSTCYGIAIKKEKKTVAN